MNEFVGKYSGVPVYLHDNGDIVIQCGNKDKAVSLMGTVFKFIPKPNDTLCHSCRKCHKFYQAKVRKDYDEDFGYTEYYTKCPFCGEENYTGSDCYWR